jgi:SAM-dependent methyltransferase
VRRILERLIGRRRSRVADRVREAVADRAGLEVGGPSRIFGPKGRLPVYAHLAVLDGADYRAATRRHPDRASDEAFVWHPDRPAGRLFVCEAVDLAGVPDETYDVVLASHVLEHVADPLRALGSWRRVTRPGGVLLVVVPHREGTFDHRRPVTALDHLVADRRRSTGEDDLTHLDEVLALHDLARDPGVDSAEALERRARANAENRGLHHHVFDTALVLRAVDQAGWQAEAVDVMRPYHVAVLARRPAGGGVDNARWWAADAAWRAHSPFAGDRPGSRPA